MISRFPESGGRSPGAPSGISGRPLRMSWAETKGPLERRWLLHALVKSAWQFDLWATRTPAERCPRGLCSGATAPDGSVPAAASLLASFHPCSRACLLLAWRDPRDRYLHLQRMVRSRYQRTSSCSSLRYSCFCFLHADSAATNRSFPGTQISL